MLPPRSDCYSANQILNGLAPLIGQVVKAFTFALYKTFILIPSLWQTKKSTPFQNIYAIL